MLVDLLPSGDLKVTFDYHPKRVQLVKAVPGKRWFPKERYWTIPSNGLRNLQQQMAVVGLPITVTGSVKEALNLGQQRRQELLALKQDTRPLELPTETTPYPYQNSGIRFLKAALHNFKGALMADDMGLGKTFMALSIIAMHERVQNVLVLAPATLKGVWADEIDLHYPQLSYTVIQGTPAKRVAQWEEDTRIKICNYELLLRDVYPRLALWDFVIADEATRLKNYRMTGHSAAKNGKQTKYVTIVGRVKALHRKYAVGLSGTPIENRLEELWSIMDFCIPGVLGEGWVFSQQHVVKDQWGGFIRYKGVEQVKERVEPYLIRRRKQEVLPDLPEKVYSDVKIELSDREWAFYKSIQNQIREEIEDNPKLNVSNILTMMLRLKQAVDDPRLLGEMDVPSTKLKAIEDIIEAAADAHKVVFFSQFAELITMLGKEYEAPVIAGPVSLSRRDEIRRQFQAGQHPYLFSTDAGAYGITLTEADIIVHIDQWWNPARLRQREDRLHRIGQEHDSVQVVTLMAQRTIDEYVRKIIHRKQELIKAVLDDEIPDEESVKLNRAELMALLGVEE